MQTTKQQGPARFPVWLSLTWITLLLSLIIVTAIEVRSMAMTVYDAYDKKSDMAELKGLILTYDEVLTMSTYMAVSTEDLFWEQRYRQHEPLLEAAISQAMTLDQDGHVAMTQVANDRLVAMEEQAFDLVRQGDAAAGQRLLGSADYHQEKSAYTMGITEAMSQLEARIEQTVAEKTREMQYVIIMVVIIACMVLVTWMQLVHRLMRWRSLLLEAQDERRQALEALQSVNQNLEARILERTQKVQSQHDELHALTSQMIAIEEQERVRLSEVLHDELQQILVTAQLRLGAHASYTATAEPERTELEDIATLIRTGIQTTRSLSSTLNPIAQSSDLFHALQHLSLRHQDNMKMEVQLDIQEGLPQPSSATHQLLIRAASEMLFNITKHAGVNTATVSLYENQNAQLRLCVEDRGVGIETQDLQNSSGLGLLSIRQRARWLGGSLNIEPLQPHGTRVVLELPT